MLWGADQKLRDLLKDNPLRHWIGPIEQESEKRDVRLSYSIDAGTIRLWVSGFQEVEIVVRPQEASYLTTEARLLQ